MSDKDAIIKIMQWPSESREERLWLEVFWKQYEVLNFRYANQCAKCANDALREYSTHKFPQKCASPQEDR